MSMAIKYAMKKKSKMARGGMCEHGSHNCHMCHGGKMMAEGGDTGFMKGNPFYESKSKEAPKKEEHEDPSANNSLKQNVTSSVQRLFNQSTANAATKNGYARGGDVERYEMTSDDYSDRDLEHAEEKQPPRPMGVHTRHGEGKSSQRHALTELRMMRNKDRKYMADGGFIAEEEASGYRKMPEDHEKMDRAAMMESDRMLNQHGEHEIGAEGMYDDNKSHMDRKVSHPVENQHGGEDEDMIGHIMRQRAKHYSKGGRVSDDVGDGQDADMEENQFDDLVKDDHLEEHYTGKNSGDEIGDEAEDEDRHDIVSQIMKSRKKKDRLPHPM